MPKSEIEEISSGWMSLTAKQRRFLVTHFRLFVGDNKKPGLNSQPNRPSMPLARGNSSAETSSKTLKRRKGRPVVPPLIGGFKDDLSYSLRPVGRSQSSPIKKDRKLSGISLVSRKAIKLLEAKRISEEQKKRSKN